MPDKYGFPKTARLLRKNEIQAVFKNRKRIRGNEFSICYRYTSDDQPPRLGIVIKKQHIPLSVNRNQVKRLVREAFRVRQKQLQGLEIIVISMKKIEKMSKPELWESLNDLFDKAIECCK